MPSKKPSVTNDSSKTESTREAIEAAGLNLAEYNRHRRSLAKEDPSVLLRWIVRQSDPEVSGFIAKVTAGNANMTAAPARVTIHHAQMAEAELFKALNSPNYDGEMAIAADPSLLTSGTVVDLATLGLPTTGPWYFSKDERGTDYVPFRPQPHLALWEKGREQVGGTRLHDLAPHADLFVNLIGRHIALAILHGDSAEIRRLADEVAKARSPLTNRLHRPRLTSKNQDPKGARWRVHRALLRALDEHIQSCRQLPSKHVLWLRVAELLGRPIPRNKRSNYLKELGFEVLPEKSRFAS